MPFEPPVSVVGSPNGSWPRRLDSRFAGCSCWKPTDTTRGFRAWRKPLSHWGSLVKACEGSSKSSSLRKGVHFGQPRSGCPSTGSIAGPSTSSMPWTLSGHAAIRSSFDLHLWECWFRGSKRSLHPPSTLCASKRRSRFPPGAVASNRLTIRGSSPGWRISRPRRLSSPPSTIENERSSCWRTSSRGREDADKR